MEKAGEARAKEARRPSLTRPPSLAPYPRPRGLACRSLRCCLLLLLPALSSWRRSLGCSGIVVDMDGCGIARWSSQPGAAAWNKQEVMSGEDGSSSVDTGMGIGRRCLLLLLLMLMLMRDEEEEEEEE